MGAEAHSIMGAEAHSLHRGWCQEQIRWHWRVWSQSATISPVPGLQVNKSSKELTEAQRELTVARSRAETAVKASEALGADTSEKLQKLDAEVGGGVGGWGWEWVGESGMATRPCLWQPAAKGQRGRRRTPLMAL